MLWLYAIPAPGRERDSRTQSAPGRSQYMHGPRPVRARSVLGPCPVGSPLPRPVGVRPEKIVKS